MTQISEKQRDQFLETLALMVEIANKIQTHELREKKLDLVHAPTHFSKKYKADSQASIRQAIAYINEIVEAYISENN